MSFKLSPWLNGYRAVALVTLDDLCPVYEPNFDFGGRMDDEGIVKKTIVNDILHSFPNIKLNMFTIPNNRYNTASPFNPYPDRAFILSNNQAWVEWLKELLDQNKQLVVATHGWIHWWENTPRPDEFTGYSSKEETEYALNNMLEEFEKVDLEYDKSFRPPGWGINPWLLEWLAANDFVLGDTPRMETSTDDCHPSWYETKNGKKLTRIAVPDTRSIDEVIELRGSCILHFHFAEPNGNSITRPQVLEEMKNSIRYIFDTWGDEIGWMSYAEMGEHYKRTKNVKYKTKREEGNINILTKNSSDELTGVTFEFSDEEPSEVRILDKSKLEVPYEIIKVGGRDCLIVNGYFKYQS